MNIKPIVITFSLLLMSASALADDDCDDPVAGWQPRENLRQKLEAEGWKVFRIKVDDGCYEVKGRDPDGHRVEAEYSPATFELREMEREDDDGHDGDRDDGHRSKSQNDSEPANEERPRKSSVKARPTVTVE
ncbi:PepSY domain-containing protein [Marinobacter psychrophilus]|uniref:PepSY domain-containing protein n=1 Tax=Marinobacter psychrophilus TaxID=330734 RepID=UPI001B3EEB03|nr:PepSY domain-containing protein [Marinobacter psychrophilus]MBQ0763138.1 PepSY domain-containing protein [Marinobacter psychrophilus]MBQ0843971.1 PepSY domain-containing protein [Marinobacter psychrophilus]